MGNIDSEFSKLDAYSQTDFNIQYEIETKSFVKSIVLSGLVNNIFDKKYSSNGYFGSYDYEDASSPTGTTTDFYSGYYPQAGINFLVGATLVF